MPDTFPTTFSSLLKSCQGQLEKLKSLVYSLQKLVILVMCMVLFVIYVCLCIVYGTHFAFGWHYQHVIFDGLKEINLLYK